MSYLGLTGTTCDDLIDALIPAASEAIENACRRRFGETAYTEYYDGGGRDRLVLRKRPVNSLSGVWDDPDREFGDDTQLDPDDYVLDADPGILLLRQGTFADGLRNVKVSYTAGYGTLPTDVAQACRMLVAAWFHRGREAADGVSNRTVAEVVQRFAAEALPEPVRRVIQSYRGHAV